MSVLESDPILRTPVDPTTENEWVDLVLGEQVNTQDPNTILTSASYSATTNEWTFVVNDTTGYTDADDGAYWVFSPKLADGTAVDLFDGKYHLEFRFDVGDAEPTAGSNAWFGVGVCKTNVLTATYVGMGAKWDSAGSDPDAAYYTATGAFQGSPNTAGTVDHYTAPIWFVIDSNARLEARFFGTFPMDADRVVLAEKGIYSTAAAAALGGAGENFFWVSVGGAAFTLKLRIRVRFIPQYPGASG